jgi:hypothetical protein
VDISELLKLWRVEKSAAQPAKMPSDFYSQAKELTEGGNPYEAKKAKDLYSDIVHMRQHKMLMGCLRELSGDHGPENLLSIEKSAYRKIYNELDAMKMGSVQAIEEVEADEDLEAETEQELEKEEQEESEEGGEGTEGKTVEEPENEEEGPAEKAGDETEEGPYEEEDAEKSEGGASEEKEEETPKKNEGEKPEAPKRTGDEEKREERPKESEGEEVPGKEQATCETTNEGTYECTVGENQGKKSKEKVFKKETENKALRRVRFLKPMPAFVGPDLQSLGPFEEDQVVELEDDIAEILLKNDAVELVEAEE